jgi:hypothetical protein
MYSRNNTIEGRAAVAKQVLVVGIKVFTSAVPIRVLGMCMNNFT